MKESSSFFEKKEPKKLLPLGARGQHIVMPAKAGIHAFAATTPLTLPNRRTPSTTPNSQKFFAELFFKKATSF